MENIQAQPLDETYDIVQGDIHKMGAPTTQANNSSQSNKDFHQLKPKPQIANLTRCLLELMTGQ